mmetsp:Transcript_37332/g.88742  ORF Transcript_37332/g.88742 Transcript_37332/m.88742 type:complete len:90 (-) Transcript_37332:2194-2463(-)
MAPSLAFALQSLQPLFAVITACMRAKKQTKKQYMMLHCSTRHNCCPYSYSSEGWCEIRQLPTPRRDPAALLATPQSSADVPPVPPSSAP